VINLEGLRPWAGLPQAALEEASVVIAGIPYDGSAVYRRGAAQAPATLRRLSAAVPPVDERGRFLDDVTLHDLGDLDAGDDIERSWESVAGRLAAIPPEAFLTVARRRPLLVHPGPGRPGPPPSRPRPALGGRPP